MTNQYLTKPERQEARIKELMEINKKLRRENIRVISENVKLKKDQIIW